MMELDLRGTEKELGNISYYLQQIVDELKKANETTEVVRGMKRFMPREPEWPQMRSRAEAARAEPPLAGTESGA